MNRTVSGVKQRRRNMLALRVGAFGIALALGVVGIWMIVTGGSPKGIRIGVIASFWALLLGAFAVLGSRVPPRDPGQASEPASQYFPPAAYSDELDRRRVGDLEPAAGSHFQTRLENTLRDEVSREMAGLRSEVTALRNELVEMVGGQLRLDRIEAARLIASEFEALQHEVRQLRRAGMEAEATLTTRIAHPLVAGAGADQDVHDAEIVVERVHPTAEPEPSIVQSIPPPAPQSAPQQSPAGAGGTAADDPFAGLPRITPFTDFPLDPILPSDDAGDYSGRGRRHRADDNHNDVLARILARERGR